MRIKTINSIQARFLAGLLLLLAFATWHLAAQTLSLSPTSIGGITHSYFGDEGMGEDAQPFTFGTPAVELADYDTIEVTVSAPEGEVWNISYSGQGLDTASLLFTVAYNNSFSEPWADVTSSSWQLDYASGSSANVDNFNNNAYAVPDSGDRFDLEMAYNVTGDLSFTGFTASITFDNSTLATAALTDFSSSLLDYQYELSDSSAPDPGMLMTLQEEEVPEPPAIAFLGLGLTGMLVWIRRRA